MRSFTKTALLALVMAIFSAGLFAQTFDPNYKDGMIFFKLKDDVLMKYKVNEDKTVSPQDLFFMKELLGKYKITTLSRPFDLFGDPKLLRTFQLEFDDFQNIDQIIKDLTQIDVIEYAEKVGKRELLWVPNDPYYNSTASGQNWKWHLQQIKAEQAWDILQSGSSSIKVAIVDNAVWAGHEDLNISTANQYNAVTQTVGNSAPPTTVSQTCVVSGGQPSSSYDWSHGTHCAGNVGATNNNGIGVASIGSGVTLMGIRVADNSGSMWSNTMLNGVQWASTNGAKVISMSYGGTGSQTTEQNLMNTCFNNGISLFAAAGNDGTTQQLYPAAYSSVIAVGSTDSNKKLSDFSQYGSWVDIAAPGGYMNLAYGIAQLSTTYCKSCVLKFQFSGTSPMPGYYDVMQGTSMACPIAAGLAGLMLSLNPALTPTQVKNCMMSTAQSFAAGSNAINSNGGIIDAQAAMICVQGTMSSAPVVNFSGTPTTVVEGGTVQFTDLSASGSPITSRSWNFGDGSANSTQQNPSKVYTTAGTYTVSLTATNQHGSNTATKTNYITVVPQGTGSCDTLNYPLSGTPALYGVNVGGYATGNNGYGDLAKAQKFMNTQNYTTIQGAIIWFGAASGSSNSFDVKVWGQGSNAPGATLGSVSVPLSTVVGHVNAQSLSVINFTNPVAVTGAFYVGVQLPTMAGDTVAVVSNSAGDASPSLAWEQWDDGGWYDFPTAWQGSLNVTLAIHPIACSGTVNVENMEIEEGVMMFPNPTAGSLSIAFLNETINDITVTVFNYAGEQVLNLKPNSANGRIFEMDLSSLSNGIYFVSINTGKQLYTNKVTIIK